MSNAQIAASQGVVGARKRVLCRTRWILALVASTALVAVPAMAIPAPTIDPLAGGSGGKGGGGNLGGSGGQASEEGEASPGGNASASNAGGAAVAVAIPVGSAEGTAPIGSRAAWVELTGPPYRLSAAFRSPSPGRMAGTRLP
ncbi:hypothetical protein [Methylobacterium sp. ID0610]|uniref:hypothetical protein n=1 Tax=Methylobacterium carpenticola TaxID=3344827 RepID=UPI00367E4D9C